MFDVKQNGNSCQKLCSFVNHYLISVSLHNHFLVGLSLLEYANTFSNLGRRGSIALPLVTIYGQWVHLFVESVAIFASLLLVFHKYSTYLLIKLCRSWKIPLVLWVCGGVFHWLALPLSFIVVPLNVIISHAMTPIAIRIPGKDDEEDLYLNVNLSHEVVSQNLTIYFSTYTKNEKLVWASQKCMVCCNLSGQISN